MSTPLGSPQVCRRGGETERRQRKGRQEGQLPGPQRGHHAGPHRHHGDLHRLLHLRHHPLHAPRRSHLRHLRGELERRVPDGHHPLLRGASAQEHGRHQRRAGGAHHDPADQRAGERGGPVRVRAELRDQDHAEAVRGQDQVDKRGERLGDEADRHGGEGLGTIDQLEQEMIKGGGAQPEGSKSGEDYEAEVGGCGGAHGYVGCECVGCGEGEWVYSDSRV